MSDRGAYLVCVDGSDASGRALESALRLAKRTGRKLHLLYVFQPTSTLPLDVDIEPVGDSVASALWTRDQEYRAYVEGVMKQYLAKCTEQQVACDTTLLTIMSDAVIDEVGRIVQAQEPAAVILGTRGQGAVRSLLLGSFANDCLSSLHCNVIVVH